MTKSLDLMETSFEQTVEVDYAIHVTGLVKTYRSGKRALDGLAFAVENGTIFALLGPNGAGKSTAVKVLATLSTPDAGSAMVAGLDVLSQPREVRKRIGYISQASSCDGDATGRENLLLQGHLYGMSGGVLASRADEMLFKFGLTDARDRKVEQYSGGMRRKLDIAMGMIHRPVVLFLDEPTTGLDPEARVTLWQELRSLQQQEGLTVVLTTHYLDEADSLASTVAIMDGGRLVANGTPDFLKGELRGDIMEVELGRSYGRELIDAALSDVHSLSDIVVEQNRVRACSDRGSVAGPLVMAALQASRLDVRSFQIKRPSLDDVYFRHTGKRYLSAGEAS